MIFNPPDRKKGALKRRGLEIKKPVSTGEHEAPTERAIFVIPDAAVLSSGATTAIVYDWRVGTSICEMDERSKSITIADSRLGIKGIRHKSTFDGICVNTIVFISPALGSNNSMVLFPNF